MKPISRPSRVGSFFKKSKPPTAFDINKFTCNVKEKGMLVSTGG
jgi:hypothetical protein